MTSQDTLSFESAYARLEEILEKMNSGKASLEDSLKLYEEADQLIVRCQKQLNSAEKKIEVLIKNREGELVADATGKPQTQEFVPGQQAPLTRNLI
ncbi:MAG: exodeoxyribonuclease VII small subunit [Rhabdochlamydiaceae bacterium]|nr:exodeoxyribonuclease VII small subunit [Rhabdochlamydiaceae bacterium]